MCINVFQTMIEQLQQNPTTSDPNAAKRNQRFGIFSFLSSQYPDG